VADVGAGKGQMALLVARRVGPSGHVFVTELDPKRSATIQKAIARQKLINVTVVPATETETGLPEACCDSILLRGVYHHLTHPKEVDASLLRSLRPGGRLAVVDFPHSFWLSLFFPTKGVPSNRGG